MLIVTGVVVGGKKRVNFICNIPLLPYNSSDTEGQLTSGELHVMIPLLEKGKKGKFRFNVPV
ncbi:hypothetical protein Hanom_Chr08g00716511 [Helianthus anomalus]